MFTVEFPFMDVSLEKCETMREVREAIERFAYDYGFDDWSDDEIIITDDDGNSYTASTGVHVEIEKKEEE